MPSLSRKRTATAQRHRQCRQKSQKQRQQQKVTAAQSLTLAKNLLKTAFSSVAHARLFPAGCFERRTVTGLEIPVLSPTRAAEQVGGRAAAEVAQVAAWLEDGVNHALSRQYLAGVVLEVRRDAECVEKYDFDVVYGGSGGGGVQVSSKSAGAASGKTEVRESVTALVRGLVLLMDAMPPPIPAEEGREILCRIRYTVGTPPDYQPPLFVEAVAEDNAAVPSSVDVRVGVVETDHHKVTARVRTNSEKAPRLSISQRMEEDDSEGEEDSYSDSLSDSTSSDSSEFDESEPSHGDDRDVDRAREHVLRVGHARMGLAKVALGLDSLLEVRRLFEQLVRDGVLVARGKSFRIK